MAETLDPIAALSNSIALTFDAIAAARKALLRNPSTDDERTLNRKLAALELVLAHLTEDMNAHIAAQRNWSGPTAAQQSEIEGLMAKAGELTTEALTVTSAIQFTTKVLALATKIADDA